jgi:acylphosphatase
VATGEPGRIERLIAWLSEGPPAAEVRAVDVVVAITTPCEGFEIRRDGGDDSDDRRGTEGR